MGCGVGGVEVAWWRGWVGGVGGVYAGRPPLPIQPMGEPLRGALDDCGRVPWYINPSAPTSSEGLPELRMYVLPLRPRVVADCARRGLCGDVSPCAIPSCFRLDVCEPPADRNVWFKSDTSTIESPSRVYVVDSLVRRIGTYATVVVIPVALDPGRSGREGLGVVLSFLMMGREHAMQLPRLSGRIITAASSAETP